MIVSIAATFCSTAIGSGQSVPKFSMKPSICSRLII